MQHLGAVSVPPVQSPLRAFPNLSGSHCHVKNPNYVCAIAGTWAAVPTHRCALYVRKLPGPLSPPTFRRTRTGAALPPPPAGNAVRRAGPPLAPALRAPDAPLAAPLPTRPSGPRPPRPPAVPLPPPGSSARVGRSVPHSCISGSADVANGSLSTDGQRADGLRRCHMGRLASRPDSYQSRASRGRRSGSERERSAGVHLRPPSRVAGGANAPRRRAERAEPAVGHEPPV